MALAVVFLNLFALFYEPLAACFSKKRAASSRMSNANSEPATRLCVTCPSAWRRRTDVARNGRSDATADANDRRPPVRSSRRAAAQRADPSPHPPSGQERQPIEHRRHTYHLRDSDVRTLATIGAFEWSAATISSPCARRGTRGPAVFVTYGNKDSWSRRPSLSTESRRP